MEESFSIYGVKTLCPSIFDKTIIHILSIIINQNYEHNELVMEAKSIINLVSAYFIKYTFYTINIYIQNNHSYILC